MTSPFHLGFHFESAYKNHLDSILGFYDHTLQDFSDDLIVEGQRVVLHAVEDGKNIVQPRHGVSAMLLGGAVFCQLAFKRSFFSHQNFDAWIGEQLSGFSAVTVFRMSLNSLSICAMRIWISMLSSSPPSAPSPIWICWM